jgi:hypothetical protein
MPRHDHAVLKATSQGQATAQRDMGMAWHVWISIGPPETPYGRPARVRLLPATTRISTKHTNPLNCRTNSSDISVYHANFHAGHGTVGEWQWRGMAYVNLCGTAWLGRERNGRGMACVNKLKSADQADNFRNCYVCAWVPEWQVPIAFLLMNLTSSRHKQNGDFEYMTF